MMCVCVCALTHLRPHSVGDKLTLNNMPCSIYTDGFTHISLLVD